MQQLQDDITATAALPCQKLTDRCQARLVVEIGLKASSDAIDVGQRMQHQR